MRTYEARSARYQYSQYFVQPFQQSESRDPIGVLESQLVLLHRLYSLTRLFLCEPTIQVYYVCEQTLSGVIFFYEATPAPAHLKPLIFVFDYIPKGEGKTLCVIG